MMTHVDYNKSMRELQIAFTSGKTYVYFDVPQSVFRDLLKAGSKGSFFLDNIKDIYPYSQVRSRRMG